MQQYSVRVHHDWYKSTMPDNRREIEEAIATRMLQDMAYIADPTRCPKCHEPSLWNEKCLKCDWEWNPYNPKAFAPSLDDMTPRPRQTHGMKERTYPPEPCHCCQKEYERRSSQVRYCPICRQLPQSQREKQAVINGHMKRRQGMRWKDGVR